MTTDALEGGAFTIVEGRDDWLFLESAENVDVMRLYADADYMPQHVVDQWCATLKKRRQYFAELGITYVMVVLPEACTIYPEALPAGVSLDAPAPARRVMEGLDPDTARQLIYVDDVLVSGKAEGLTFRKTDSHWTDWGAWLTYQATMGHLAKLRPDIDVLDASRVSWNITPMFGALGVAKMHDVPEMLPVAEIAESRCALSRHVTNEIRDSFMVVEQDRPELPTAVVFRDSSMTNAHKFFSESFRRTTYTSQPNAVLRDLIDRERPDVVLFVTGERRLFKGPNDATTHDFRHMFGDLLMDDPSAVAAQVESRSMLRNGDITAALAANDIAMDAGPTARLLLHRAKCFVAMGNVDAALECLRAGVTLDPDDGPLWHVYGQTLYVKGDLERAHRALVRASATSPDQPAFALSETRALLALGHADRAVERARNLVERHPDSSLVQFAYGSALADSGSLAEAEATLHEAIALDPAASPVRRKLASVLIQMRRWAEAEVVLEQLLAEDPLETVTAEWLARVQNVRKVLNE